MAEGVRFELTIPSLMVDTRTVTERASLCVPMKTDGVSCHGKFTGRRKPLVCRARGLRPALPAIPQKRFWRHPLGFGRLGTNPGCKGTMHIQSRYILTIATLAFALASGLSNVSADELKEAKVTQVIQD